MDPTLALALMAATALLVAIPGPNVALIVANTLAHGGRAGARTVFGTTLGVGLQLTVVVLGLATLLEVASGLFLWLKWLGVLYLIWLGIAALRHGSGSDLTLAADPRLQRKLMWQGLMLALINPKTLIFNAAFLPQFVSPGAGTAALATAAALYLAVIFAGDLLWVLTARSARPYVGRVSRLRHKLTGVLFIGAGVGLALARVER